MATTASQHSTSPSALDRAELKLAPLPATIDEILRSERAPPRLSAHLTLVHDVALRLLASVKRRWPNLAVDHEAVAFGAASHDIGKARHPAELSEPGALHEAAGRALLLEHGIDPRLARFAETHGGDVPELALEDRLVFAADTVWKATRSKALDDALVDAIAAVVGAPAWDTFMKLDGILGVLAKDADRRLAWQARFTVESESR